ncbi:hypothetical protein KY363_08450, partial [Candidatus Woesearchaeota archaeon]|nr:hypothetical protein [Candidatus Woesearchaeota archaeon]
MARNSTIPDSRKAGTSMGAVLVTLAVAAILAAILLGEHFGFTGLQVLETGQRIVERAEANITCTLMPLLVLAILILIILVRVSNIPEEITEKMGLINLGFMIVLLATLIPTSAHPNGACMVLADQLPILHEILLFMFLLFFTILSEGVLYFAIKRMHLPKGQAERHESHLMAGMVSAAMLIAVLTLSWIIKEAETQTVSEAARLVLYFLLLALILIAIMGVEKRARAERTLQKIPHPPLKKHISRLPSIRTGLTALRLAITVGTTLA